MIFLADSQMRKSDFHLEIFTRFDFNGEVNYVDDQTAMLSLLKIKKKKKNSQACAKVREHAVVK